MKFSFNIHRNLSGLHAPFSPSQHSWLRYDDSRAIEVYTNKKASERGTRLHAWAKETIDLGIKQPKSKKTLYSYVNDAIGFKMQTEVEIYAALFCLEYKIKPGEIDMELRLYQNDEILQHFPTAQDILPIMDRITHLNKILQKIEDEEG